MANETVLISGAGIAGPTLAFWLRAAGFGTTIVEHAPALRTGGYVIDFWGLGYDIAERMGLKPDIDRVGYRFREMRIVNRRGERIAGFGTRVFDELTGGRYVTLPRSALSRLLFEKIEPTTEVLFGDEIVGLQDREDGVQVQFRHAGSRRFDLVVGADGLHSKVRSLAFGPEERFERKLGYAVAVFEAGGYRPRDELVSVIFNEPGRMLARVGLRDDQTLFLFVFGTDATLQAVPDLPAQKAMLRDAYGDGNWECGRVLGELDRATQLYFDSVSQIRMSAWSRGRVALIGDAAFCPSLMAGQGSALAMTSAYVLAGELARAGGQHPQAFRRYQEVLRAFIASKQHGAERFAAAFAPKTRWGLLLRNQLVNLFAIPGLSRIIFGREIVDSLRLPDYHWPALAGIAARHPAPAGGSTAR
ncbi:MAG: FAD-binding domain [Xanthobacteraceae bacterium]